MNIFLRYFITIAIMLLLFPVEYVRCQPGSGKPQIILDLLKGGQGNPVYMMCDETVRSMVTSEQLSSLWDGIESQMGGYVSNGQWHDLDGVPGGTWCNVTFENGKAALVIVYGMGGKIAGLQITQALPEPAENAKDIYSLTEGWEEKDITVHTGTFSLPGKLTLPSNASPETIAATPVLIMVHGSGPNGMDEQIGPNRLFKEIACALSHKGIAVLRYDKRTFTYGNDAFKDPASPTIEEECTDDALSAASLADSLGFRHIFIAGHSLGAGMAPQIALYDRKGTINGIIMLAAPALTMRESFERQLKTVEPFNTPEDIEQMRKMFDDLPECYTDGVDYDKQAAITELCSKGFPMLFLQGERDYQVSCEEFEMWKNWVSETAEDTNVFFISYPGLNHIFHKGEGEPSPAEYAVQGMIPEKIIDDIVGFVKRSVLSSW